MSTAVNNPAPAIATDEESEEARRTCLGCDELFLSHGPGNRICPACKRRRRRAKPVGCRVWQTACPLDMVRQLAEE